MFDCILKMIDPGMQNSIDRTGSSFKADNQILNSLTLYKCRVVLMIYKELLWTGILKRYKELLLSTNPFFLLFLMKKSRLFSIMEIP